MSEAAELPDWSTRAFREFIDDQEKLAQVLEVCIRGILMVTQTPQAIELLASSSDTTLKGKDWEWQMATAKAHAELAESESQHDFPILHSQFIVTLWSSLETLVFTAIEDRLINEPKLMLEKPWCDLKIRVGDYLALDTQQRASHLVSIVDQAVGAPLKGGVGRFESLLASIGMVGTVSDDVRRTLFEFQQVRNVIVHKSGIADNRLVSNCPWLALSIGDEVRVGRQMHLKYHEAAMKYVIELIHRNRDHFGAPDIRAVEEVDSPPDPSPG